MVMSNGAGTPELTSRLRPTPAEAAILDRASRPPPCLLCNGPEYVRGFFAAKDQRRGGAGWCVPDRPPPQR